MPRPDLTRVPEFYHNYIKQVPENDLMTAFKNQTPAVVHFFQNIPANKIDYAYAEGKWTIREMLQHIIDAERVFSYRAVTFSRLDTTPLPGFDENTWAANAGATERSWNELQEEWRLLRKSNILLYESFSDHQLGFHGQANGRPLNAFTLGFIIPGHVAHHMRIIKERYL